VHSLGHLYCYFKQLFGCGNKPIEWHSHRYGDISAIFETPTAIFSIGRPADFPLVYKNSQLAAISQLTVLSYLSKSGLKQGDSILRVNPKCILQHMECY
jgi:hypothetical protein